MILQLCEVFRKSTGGYFDIAAFSGCRTVPTYRLDPATRCVTLCGADVVLDAGGFGKGYALDRVRKLLAASGVANALVNFGDSSVTTLGSHPFGDCWKVAARTGGGEFRLKGSSLSLSGLRPDGRAHIVDPTTGEWCRTIASLRSRAVRRSSARFSRRRFTRPRTVNGSG